MQLPELNISVHFISANENVNQNGLIEGIVGETNQPQPQSGVPTTNEFAQKTIKNLEKKVVLNIYNLPISDWIVKAHFFDRRKTEVVVLCFDANEPSKIEEYLKSLNKRIRSLIKQHNLQPIMLLVGIKNTDKSLELQNLPNKLKKAGFAENVPVLIVNLENKPSVELIAKRIEAMAKEKLELYEPVVRAIQTYLLLHGKSGHNEQTGWLTSFKNYANYSLGEEMRGFFVDRSKGIERVKILQGAVESIERIGATEEDKTVQDIQFTAKIELVANFMTVLSQSSDTVFSLKHIWACVQTEKCKALSVDALVKALQENENKAFSLAHLKQ